MEQGPKPLPVSGKRRFGCCFSEERSLFSSRRILSDAHLHLKYGVILLENCSSRLVTHAGSLPKFSSQLDRMYSCDVYLFWLKSSCSWPLKMTLIQRSRKRRQRGIEMSSVVVGGVMTNFLPRPKRALASGGALLSRVRS